jgi:hypothetical protein
MSTANLEMTVDEALKLTNSAIDQLQSDLAELALEFTGTSSTAVSTEYAGMLLERRKANKAARDRIRLVLLDMISREFSITPVEEEDEPDNE